MLKKNASSKPATNIKHPMAKPVCFTLSPFEHLSYIRFNNMFSSNITKPNTTAPTMTEANDETAAPNQFASTPSV